MIISERISEGSKDSFSSENIILGGAPSWTHPWLAFNDSTSISCSYFPLILKMAPHLLWVAVIQHGNCPIDSARLFLLNADILLGCITICHLVVGAEDPQDSCDDIVVLRKPLPGWRLESSACSTICIWDEMIRCDMTIGRLGALAATSQYGKCCGPATG